MRTTPESTGPRDLNAAEMKSVGGGAAVDFFLKIEGIPGESRLEIKMQDVLITSFQHTG